MFRISYVTYIIQSPELKLSRISKSFGLFPRYLWIKEWKVERLVDALKLSRASGIPIEKFASEMMGAERPKESK